MGNSQSEKKIYEDFEPECKYITGEHQDTVDIILRGFHRQHIKCEIERGKVIISGERPLNPPRYQRFRKEIKLKSDHDHDPYKIHPLLTDRGVLVVRLPKKEIRFKKQISRVSSKLNTTISDLHKREEELLVKYGKDIMHYLFDFVKLALAVTILIRIYYYVPKILEIATRYYCK
ncbi:hypothetical protein L6164_006309 [Bauhinia variegata]|uniref:Uncharacterized protein n=1 Tax=Bauhinia variegata TaxID=167791 RepID=A0ACB9PT90_BAUVA|nr:hypothetical protein L6164_006309 [Bauhinia variegata]